jgi:hypothetical protein
MQFRITFFLQLERYTFFFESLIIIGAPILQASLMDLHHDTSLRFILEDDSISFISTAHIHFRLSKGAGLWLNVKPSIYSSFTLVMHFCFGLI